MRLHALVALALACALALSGCATKKEKDREDGPTASGSTSDSATGTGAPGANHPPSATMQANATGAAPTNVTFVLNATDQDQDILSWRLDFGDNATANGTFQRGAVVNASVQAQAVGEVANVTHLYATAGNYTARLSVSDGKATTNVSLNLTITAGTPFDQFVASGTPDLPCPQCSTAGANTGAGYRGGINELDSWFVDIPPASAGQPFTIAAAENVDAVFRDGCDGGAAVGDTFLADGDEAGIVPEGALCLLAWLPSAAGETITLTIG